MKLPVKAPFSGRDWCRAISERQRETSLTLPAQQNNKNRSLEVVLASYNALVVPQSQRQGFDPTPTSLAETKGVAGDDVIFALLDAFPICKTGQGGMKYFEFPLSIPVFAGSNTSAWSPDRAIAVFTHAGIGEATFGFFLHSNNSPWRFQLTRFSPTVRLILRARIPWSLPRIRQSMI